MTVHPRSRSDFGSKEPIAKGTSSVLPTVCPPRVIAARRQRAAYPLPNREIASCCVSTCMQCLTRPRKSVDFRKLKLRNCAPLSLIAALALPRWRSCSPHEASGRKAPSAQCGSGVPGLRKRSIRATRLRGLHGSGGITRAVHCFRIVFSMSPCSGAMHFRGSKSPSARTIRLG